MKKNHFNWGDSSQTWLRKMIRGDQPILRAIMFAGLGALTCKAFGLNLLGGLFKGG